MPPQDANPTPSFGGFGISERWLSSGLPPLNWGIAGLLAVGGTGAGIVQAIVIAIVTLIAALAGGFVGAQLKRSM